MICLHGILLSPLRNGMITICTEQSFCLHLFGTEGNGHLYVPIERNHFIQTGPNLFGQSGENLRKFSLFHHGHTEQCGFRGILGTTQLS